MFGLHITVHVFWVRFFSLFFVLILMLKNDSIVKINTVKNYVDRIQINDQYDFLSDTNQLIFIVLPSRRNLQYK